MRFEYSNCNCIVVGSEVSEDSDDSEGSEDSEVSDNSEVSDDSEVSDNSSQLTPPPISQPSIPPPNNAQQTTDHKKIK